MGIISIKEQTTTDKDKFEQLRKADTSLLLTNATKIEEFAIELSIGDNWAEKLSAELPQLFALKKEEIKIRAKNSIVIETAESLFLPNNMYGLIMPRGSLLLQQGIFMSSTKIEPSFNGKLQILLYNSSNRTRILKKGQFIASAVFFRTEETTISSIAKTKTINIEKDRGWFEKLRMAITANHAIIIPFSALIVSILSLIITSIR